MKKKAIKIFLVILFVLGIFFGKRYIDSMTFDYTEIVNDSLSSYYVSGVINDLKPIVELLEKYNNDEKMRNNIQTYSFKIVGGWYTYLDGKYFCDRGNLNSCKIQFEEFNALSSKLTGLYNYKSKNGYTIILPSGFNNLKSEGDKKIAGLKKIIESPSAKNPSDSEEIRIKKCKVAVDCEGCRDGVCKCYYINENNNREVVTCQKEEE